MIKDCPRCSQRHSAAAERCGCGHDFRGDPRERPPPPPALRAGAREELTVIEIVVCVFWPWLGLILGFTARSRRPASARVMLTLAGLFMLIHGAVATFVMVISR